MTEALAISDSGFPSGFVAFVKQRVHEEVKTRVESEVESQLAEVLATANFPEISQMLHGHEKAIHGNGRPGLTEQFAVHTEKMASLEKAGAQFDAFMAESRADVAKIFARMDLIEDHYDQMRKDMDSMKKSLETLLQFQAKLDRILLSLGFVAAIGGAILAFLGWIVAHWDKIVNFIHGPLGK
jgi:ribosomal protein S15P/S13E